MLPTQARRTATTGPPQIQCGGCQEILPLRLTKSEEPAAVWLCAQCNISFVACCVKEALLKNAGLVRLDERFFDISGQPEISLSERQRAAKLASRPLNVANFDKRRSERVSQSLVVPASRLGDDFVPVGEPFPLMISNLSREGVGMINNCRIETEHIAIEFSPTSQSPIQVIVRLVRQRDISPLYVELGGELLVRLGSIAIR